MAEHHNLSVDVAPTEELQLRQMVQINQVHFNTSQSLIVTTEDKLRLSLISHLNRVERKREWLTPFGVLTAVITTLITATFQNYGLSANVWEAIFIITGLGAFGWLAWCIKELKNSVELEDIVKDVKAASDNIVPVNQEEN